MTICNSVPHPLPELIEVYARAGFRGYRSTGGRTLRAEIAADAAAFRGTRSPSIVPPGKPWNQCEEITPRTIDGIPGGFRGTGRIFSPEVARLTYGLATDYHRRSLLFADAYRKIASRAALISERGDAAVSAARACKAQQSRSDYYAHSLSCLRGELMA